jgi:hypothetical protein
VQFPPGKTHDKPTTTDYTITSKPRFTEAQHNG